MSFDKKSHGRKKLQGSRDASTGIESVKQHMLRNLVENDTSAIVKRAMVSAGLSKCDICYDVNMSALKANCGSDTPHRTSAKKLSAYEIKSGEN